MVKPSFDIGSLKQEFMGGLLAVDRLAVKRILTVSLPGFSPYELIEELVVPTLEDIGRGWESGRYSLSQVYMSGRICEEVIDLILPPHHETRRYQPKTAIVVLEDFHLLGKRIVYSVLRASGFELANYGRLNVEDTARRIEADQIEILLISVLMLPSALRIRELRDLLNKQNSRVKIVVGGAPFRFDPELWEEVGADAMGATATEAVEIIDRLAKDVS